MAVIADLPGSDSDGGRATNVLADEPGFTLVELVAVMLMMGILAAVALSASLGQGAKAQDASAKADVRTAVSDMEVCFADAETYVGCTTTSQATISGRTATGFVVTRLSESGNTYTTTSVHGAHANACIVPAGRPRGGCPIANAW